MFGLLWLAVGVGLLLSGTTETVGLVLIAIPAVVGVLAWAVSLVQGHRGRCLLWRGPWLGLALVGLVPRVLVSLPF